MTEGLDYITQVICRFAVIEDSYRERQNYDARSVEQARAIEFEEALVKVYLHILLYQISVVTQLSRSKLGQLGRDVIKTNDWAELLTSIRDAETEFNRRREVLDSGQLNRGLKHQAQQMDTLLEKHRELEETARETLESIRENRCHAAFRVSDYVSDKERNPKRVPGTCGWLMEHENYHKWVENDRNDLLWVSADPGCGKSVLSRFLVEELLSAEDTTVCYFFFKDEGKDQKNASSAVCGILHQLYNVKPALLKHALPSFDRESDKLRNLFGELWAILRASVTDPAAGNMICILDAPDECEESGRVILIDALKQSYKSPDWNGTNGSVKFLVTSRPYQSIERKFKTLTNALPEIRLAGEEETESIKQEIDLVIRDRVRGDGGLRVSLELDSKTTEALESKLLSMDHRTYLWLKLVLSELESNYSGSTSKKLLAFIDVIPQTVEEAYESILNRSTNKELARKILNIVVAAQRPLTLAEMDIALAVQDHSKSEAELDLEGDKNLKNNIRNLCGLFLNVTDSKIFLIHQTAREFLSAKDDVERPAMMGSTHLVWKNSVNVTQSNLVLTEICLRYISLAEFDNCPLEPLSEIIRVNQERDHDKRVNDFLGQHMFLDYAASFWTGHAKNANIQDDSLLLHAMVHVCDTTSRRFLAWFVVESRVHWPPKTSPSFALKCSSLLWPGPAISSITKQRRERQR